MIYWWFSSCRSQVPTWQQWKFQVAWRSSALTRVQIFVEDCSADLILKAT